MFLDDNCLSTRQCNSNLAARSPYDSLGTGSFFGHFSSDAPVAIRDDFASRLEKCAPLLVLAANGCVPSSVIFRSRVQSANPVIGDRSFGRAPEVVAAMGAAFVRGLQGGGVAGCGKHFPGHGDTEQDSHLDLPRLPHDAERLRRVELPPFRAAIQAGVASIMTAHVVFQAVDPDVPATMSRRVLQDILRGELGFRGAIVSDDLEMKAIADRMDLGEAALRAVEAGVDLLLCCHEAARQERIVAALAEAIASGRLPEARVRESLARIQPLAGTA